MSAEFSRARVVRWLSGHVGCLVFLQARSGATWADFPGQVCVDDDGACFVLGDAGGTFYPANADAFHEPILVEQRPAPQNTSGSRAPSSAASPPPRTPDAEARAEAHRTHMQQEAAAANRVAEHQRTVMLDTAAAAAAAATDERRVAQQRADAAAAAGAHERQLLSTQAAGHAAAAADERRQQQQRTDQHAAAATANLASAAAERRTMHDANVDAHRAASTERSHLARQVANIEAQNANMTNDMADLRRMLASLVSAVSPSPGLSPIAPAQPAHTAHHHTTAINDTSLADLTAEMRRQRGCVEDAASSDIFPDVFAALSVRYRWRSDDDAAPTIRQALRKLAGHLRNIARIGPDAFAAEIRSRLELQNLNAHVVEVGLLQLLPHDKLCVALAELALSIWTPDGRRERDLLIIARAAPPPTSKQEADHWRRGAQVPTEPVHTRIPQARASNNNNQRATSTNANNNAGTPGNNNAQNSRGRQGAPASKN